VQQQEVRRAAEIFRFSWNGRVVEWLQPFCPSAWRPNKTLDPTQWVDQGLVAQLQPTDDFNGIRKMAWSEGGWPIVADRAADSKAE